MTAPSRQSRGPRETVGGRVMNDHDLVRDFANNIRAIGGNESMRGVTSQHWAGAIRAFGFFSFETEFATIDGHAVSVEYISRDDVRPREGLRVFRGCAPTAMDSIYWESSLATAIRYAVNAIDPIIRHDDPHLYSVVVPPENILARINGTEWLIDTDGLTITDHGRVQAMALPRVRVRDLPDSVPSRDELVANGLGDIEVVREPNLKLQIHDPAGPPADTGKPSEAL